MVRCFLAIETGKINGQFSFERVQTNALLIFNVVHVQAEKNQYRLTLYVQFIELIQDSCFAFGYRFHKSPSLCLKFAQRSFART